VLKKAKKAGKGKPKNKHLSHKNVIKILYQECPDDDDNRISEVFKWTEVFDEN